MHVLQSIQEYAPVKHSIVFFSSWIASYRAKPADVEETSGDVTDLQPPCGSLNDNQTFDEQLNADRIELNGNTNQTEVSDNSDVETEFITRSNDAGENASLDSQHENKEPDSSRTDGEDADFQPSLLGTAGTVVLDGKDAAGPRLTQTEIDSSHHGCNGRVICGDCTRGQEDSDIVDSEYDTHGLRNRRLTILKDKGSKFVFRNFRLSAFHRKKKKKRRGNRLSNFGSHVRMPVCACATGNTDLCLVHAKSQSEESDVSSVAGLTTGLYRMSDDYLADASDMSLRSFSLADDDDSGDYIDIDVYHLRNSLIDSSSCCSQSEKSLELSSDWSEICFSSCDLSLAEECRESDIADTASDFSQDSRSTHTGVQRRRRTHGRFNKMALLGHNVNESFMENECCHCIVM